MIKKINFSKIKHLLVFSSFICCLILMVLSTGLMFNQSQVVKIALLSTGVMFFISMLGPLFNMFCILFASYVGIKKFKFEAGLPKKWTIKTFSRIYGIKAFWVYIIVNHRIIPCCTNDSFDIPITQRKYTIKSL